MIQRSRRPLPRLPWAMFTVPAAAGVPVGVLWWLLAPGGLNLVTRDPSLADGRNPAVWFPRDLTLAALLVFAGCLLAVFIADRKPGGREASRQRALPAGLAGALCGALVAWLTGLLSAQLWGPAVDTSANASIAFSLRSYPVLLLWPAATAVSLFMLELLNLLGRKPDGGADVSEVAPSGPVK